MRSVKLRRKRINPTSLVLYRFFNADGGLLYVGQSMRAWERFADHQRAGTFYPQAASVTLERGFRSLQALTAAEARAIRHEKPQFNVAHNTRPKSRPQRNVPPADGCQGPHHCRKPMVDDCHNLDACRARDEADRAIASRVEGGESAESVAADLGKTVELVTRTHAEVRDELAAGVHGCWEHDPSGEAVSEIAKSFKVSADTVYRVIKADDEAARAQDAEEAGSDG